MKGTRRIVNTLIIRVKGYYLPLLFISVALTFYSCIDKDYFTDEELKAINVYKPGDKFKMLNTKGDTFVFVIKDRSLRKLSKADALGSKKFEELLYKIEVYDSNNQVGGGQFWSRSLGNEFEINYNIGVVNCHFVSGIDLSQTIDTFKINGISYRNVSCNLEGSCFAKGIGFIRLSQSCGIDTLIRDTLSLIK